MDAADQANEAYQRENELHEHQWQLRHDAACRMYDDNPLDTLLLVIDGRDIDEFSDIATALTYLLNGSTAKDLGISRASLIKELTAARRKMRAFVAEDLADENPAGMFDRRDGGSL